MQIGDQRRHRSRQDLDVALQHLEAAKSNSRVSLFRRDIPAAGI